MGAQMPTEKNNPIRENSPVWKTYPLTDEELTEIEQRCLQLDAYLYLARQPREVVKQDVPELIAAYRSSRKEIEELKVALTKTWHDGYNRALKDWENESDKTRPQPK